MRRSRCGARLGALAVGVLVLAACDFGTTGTATQVADTSADLHATVHTEDPGTTLSWWFEYGPTSALGATTPEGTVTFPPTNTSPVPVSATISGLAEGTTYHYRACVRNADGGGVCGAQRTVTTTTGHDSVTGQGIAALIPELGYVLGADVDARSAPDGTAPEGTVSRMPGTYYFRLPDEGAVTCLRVEGDRAAVGFTADWTGYDPSLELVHLVLHVEDNGTSGDRFAVAVVDAPPVTCPDPDVLLDATPGNTVAFGGFVVHDHP